MLVFGGFFISVTVYAFILFARFMEREKVAAAEFRAKHGPRKSRQEDDDQSVQEPDRDTLGDDHTIL